MSIKIYPVLQDVSQLLRDPALKKAISPSYRYSAPSSSSKDAITKRFFDTATYNARQFMPGNPEMNVWTPSQASEINKADVIDSTKTIYELTIEGSPHQNDLLTEPEDLLKYVAHRINQLSIQSGIQPCVDLKTHLYIDHVARNRHTASLLLNEDALKLLKIPYQEGEKQTVRIKGDSLAPLLETITQEILDDSMQKASELSPHTNFSRPLKALLKPIAHFIGDHIPQLEHQIDQYQHEINQFMDPYKQAFESIEKNLKNLTRRLELAANNPQINQSLIDSLEASINKLEDEKDWCLIKTYQAQKAPEIAELYQQITRLQEEINSSSPRAFQTRIDHISILEAKAIQNELPKVIIDNINEEDNTCSLSIKPSVIYQMFCGDLKKCDKSSDVLKIDWKTKSYAFDQRSDFFEGKISDPSITEALTIELVRNHLFFEAQRAPSTPPSNLHQGRVRPNSYGVFVPNRDAPSPPLKRSSNISFVPSQSFCRRQIHGSQFTSSSNSRRGPQRKPQKRSGLETQALFSATPPSFCNTF